MHQRAIASLVHGLLNKIVHSFDDEVWSCVDADDMVDLNHLLIELSLILKPVVLHLVNLAELSDGLKEFISRASFLWLEER
jgi:hypothetical protein